MSKVYTGIQIGNYSVKLTQVTDDKIDKISVTPLPENLVKDGRILSVDAMSELIKRRCRSFIGRKLCKTHYYALYAD